MLKVSLGGGANRSLGVTWEKDRQLTETWLGVGGECVARGLGW